MKLAVASIFVALCVLCIDTVHGADDAIKKECDLRVKRNLKRLVKEFGECNREIKKDLGLTTEQHAKKLGCALKCVMKKENFLDANDMVTDEIMQKAIEAEGIPLKEYADHVMTFFKECKTKYGDKLDPKEESCQTYTDFGNCIHQVIAEYCDEHVNKVDWSK